MPCAVVRSIRIALASAVVLAVAAACAPVGPPAQLLVVSGRPVRAVATIGMINNIVQEIGGEHVQSLGLMGPGVDPHLYKASEGDVIRLSGADIVFYNGLHLEAKMAEVLERMAGRIRTVAVTDYIDRSRLLAPPEFAGAYDPHVWFDVTMWIQATERVRDSLVELNPENRDNYLARSERYLAELRSLDEYVRTQAASIPTERRVLITAHDAFNYFGRAYGFEVRGLQGISTVSEAGAADVQSLARFITDQRIPALFVESSIPRRNIEALQAAVQARDFAVEIGGVLFSDAMGSPGTPEGTYIGMVRHNIDTIVAGLR